ncbi:hypothetical protein B7H16_01775 [Anoxybacillus ayderensis]|nr:hypothetical protein B7H16_01775 [Anoxybacillus ayderensis]
MVNGFIFFGIYLFPPFPAIERVELFLLEGEEVYISNQYQKQWETPQTPESPIDVEALKERLKRYK